ncbi:MAG: glycoside hydrolase family 16 protein [Pseudomonadota bacterium]
MKFIQLLPMAPLCLLIACGGNSANIPATTVTPPLAGPGKPAINEAGGLPAKYQLVWSDEFNQAGLPDASKWAYDTMRNKQGWYNEEKQYYANARAKNSRLVDGNLVIEVHKEKLDAAQFDDYGDQNYTSARLSSSGKASWKYGFFEIKAKLPCGRGTWPAIWTLSSQPYTNWPDDGEIDIMEHVGFDEGVVHGSVHTKAYYHQINTHMTSTTKPGDVCGQFHRYQMTWTADRITVGIDDKNFFQFSNDGANNRHTWPFNRPQHLLLNVAVGGTWGGMKGIDDAVYPVKMEVDYVRVYQLPQ